MTNTKRAFAVMMTMLLAISAVGMAFTGGVAASEPSVESSSDLTAGDTWADYNASADDNKLIEYTNTDAEDGAIVVWDPETGDSASDAQTHLELDAEDDEFETVDSANDLYGFNITGDDLETVPMEAGENKTVTVTISNQSDWEGDDANLTTMDITLDNTMERSVMYLGNYQIENEAYGLSHSNEEPTSFGGFDVPFTGNQQTSLDASRTIDGSNTTVYAYMANDSVQSQFNDDFGSLDAGDWTKGTLTQLGDSPIRNYASELPGDLSSDTSALKFDSSGSTDALVLELGDSYDGEESLDMSVNSDPGRWEQITSYGVGFFSYNFELPDWVPGMVVPVTGSLAGLVVFGRPEIEA